MSEHEQHGHSQPNEAAQNQGHKHDNPFYQPVEGEPANPYYQPDEQGDAPQYQPHSSPEDVARERHPHSAAEPEEHA